MSFLKSKLVWSAVVIVVLILLWQNGILSWTSNKYQAVFLSNNQVYFGKLSSLRSSYPVLKDVYYLQVTQALQPKTSDSATQPQINLVKLGGELHGPEDAMAINSSHILFVEDLKGDSKVVSAIKEYQTTAKAQ